MSTVDPDPTPTPALETRALTRHFGDFTAVDGISFTVPAGSIFGLLGPNGAGKSTTIKMLTTLLPPTAGTGLVAGFDIVKQSVDVRRLEIAQSMLHRPAVLFLDEPTVGLDPVARRNVWEHITRLRAEFGTTILLTTHYMEEADELCESVAIMHHGQIITMGSPAEIKEAAGATTLDDAFAHFTASSIKEGGSYRDAARARRTARRLS